MTEKLDELKCQFDLCLNATPATISSALFNSYLDTLTVGLQPITKQSLMEIDSYYIKAHQSEICFDVITFNILLKAVRLAQPEICGGLVAAYLNEMHELGIQEDAYTINQLLCMAARNPNHASHDRVHSNKWVADQEYKYYLKHMYHKHCFGQCRPLFVLNSYLNVYAEDGDWHGMKYAMRIAKDGGMRLQEGLRDTPIDITFQKGLRKWCVKTGYVYDTDTVNISIYDYF